MQQVVEEPEMEDEEIDETDEEQVIDFDGSGQHLTYVDNSSVSWRVIACELIRQEDPQQ